MGTFLPSSRWSQNTCKNAGIRAGGYFGGHLGFSKLLLGGLCGLQGTPTKGENAPSSLLPSAVDSRNRIPSFLQGIMPPRGLLPCKNAGILAVARDPEKMQGILPAALDWALSGHLRMTLMYQNTFSKKPFNLEPFCWLRFGSHRGGHGTP